MNEFRGPILCILFAVDEQTTNLVVEITLFGRCVDAAIKHLNGRNVKKESKASELRLVWALIDNAVELALDAMRRPNQIVVSSRSLQ